MSNEAATGYAILAAASIGLDDETVRKLYWAMYHVMDEYAEDEAEEVYRKA